MRKKAKITYSNPIDLYKKIYSGKIGRFPSGYLLYDTDNAACREIIRFFVNHILGLDTRERILKEIRQSDFQDNKLGGMLNIKYRSSPSLAIIDAFPELNIKPWEFDECPNSYWKGKDGEKRAIDAFRYVFLERCKYSKKEIDLNLTRAKITELNLFGALRRGFDDSLAKAALKSFPEYFTKEWELSTHIPNGYWTKEKGAEALRWLLEDKLGYDRASIIKNMNRDFFKKYGLYGMLQKHFNNNAYLCLEYAYPGEYKVWEVIRVPSDYWNEETVQEALNWLVYEKLEITLEEAMNLMKKDLWEHGLYGLSIYEKGSMKYLIKKYIEKT